VDAGMLAVAARLAAAYAYFVATAGEAEARWLAREMVARARARLARTAQEGYARAAGAASPEELAGRAQGAERRLAFCADRAAAGLQTLLRLAPGLGATVEAGQQALRAAAEEERLSLRADLASLSKAEAAPMPPAAPAGEWDERATRLVLRRRFRGPVDQKAVLARLDAAGRKQAEGLAAAHREAMHALPAHLLYWIDGRRSLAEIIDLIECETGRRDAELAVRLAELMVQAGLLEETSEGN